MKTRMTGRRALTLAAAFGFASVAFAETNTWTGAESNAWATPENWDTLSVPTAEDVVRFDGDAGVLYDAAALPVTNFVEKIELVGDAKSVRISNADSSVRRLHVLGKTGQSDGYYRFVDDASKTLTFAGKGLNVDVATAERINGRGVIVKGTVVADDEADVSIHGLDVGDNHPTFSTKNGANLRFYDDVSIWDCASFTLTGEGQGSDVDFLGNFIKGNTPAAFTINLYATNHSYFGMARVTLTDGSATLNLVAADDSTVQIGTIKRLPAGSSILLARSDMILNDKLTLGDSNPITLTVDGHGTIENDDSSGAGVEIGSKATVKFRPGESSLDRVGVFNTCVEGKLDVVTIAATSKLDIDMTDLGVDESKDHWEIPYIKCRTPKNSDNKYDITALAIPVITITEGYDCKFKREKVTDSTMKVTLVVNRSEVKTWSADAESAWNVDGSWTEGVAPAADDAVVFEKDATVVLPESATAAGLTVAEGKAVTFKTDGVAGGVLDVTDDALKTSIGKDATVAVCGNGKYHGVTLRITDSQGAELGDNVTLKTTDGGYIKISDIDVSKASSVKLDADGELSEVKFQSKGNKVTRNTALNMKVSNGGLITIADLAWNGGAVNLEATDGGQVDAFSIDPAYAGSSLSLSNGTIRLAADNGALYLGTSKKTATLTLAGDTPAIVANSGNADITFGADLTVKLFPTEAWTEDTPIVTLTKNKLTFDVGTKYEIDVSEFGEIDEFGKLFRLGAVTDAAGTLAADPSAMTNVTVVGGENLTAVFQLSDDGKALDVVIAPMSDDDIPTQVANAKSGAFVPAPGVVIAEDGKSFTYDGGADSVSKEHYVFKAAEGGVEVEIDPAEAEIGSIEVEGDTVSVTLVKSGFAGFWYALDVSETPDFDDSEITQFIRAVDEPVLQTVETGSKPAQFFRAVVTDVEQQND